MILTSWPFPCTGLRTDDSGAVAIEFALLLPILLVLLLGTFEISKYIQTNNQVVQTVNMIGQMASQLPASAKAADAQRIWSAAPLIAPEAHRVAERLGSQAWSDVLAVTITSIVFTKRIATCKTNCEYDGNVDWSVGQNAATCGKIRPGEVIRPTSQVIPTALYGEGSVLLVQASLPYGPYLTGTSSFLVGMAQALTTTMSEASWFLPRNASRIALSAVGTASPRFVICPGVAL